MEVETVRQLIISLTVIAFWIHLFWIHLFFRIF